MQPALSKCSLNINGVVGKKDQEQCTKGSWGKRVLNKQKIIACRCQNGWLPHILKGLHNKTLVHGQQSFFTSHYITHCTVVNIFISVRLINMLR